jgi:ubiquitin carboxyl-terminal hydrolase 9/24
MSLQASYTQFLLQLADKGCTLQHSQLRDAARALLKLMPADVETIQKMKNICQELIKNPIGQPVHGFDSLFFSPSPSETCYNLEVCYSLLMPGTGPLTEKAFDFQIALVEAKGIACFMGMLTRNDFLSRADLSTQQMAYLSVLKICKLLFAVAGHSLVHMVADACQPDSTSSVTPAVHNQVCCIPQ